MGAGADIVKNKMTLEDQNGENPKSVQNISGVFAISGIKVGTAVLPADSDTVEVTHGVGATPVAVTAFPNQNIGQVWIPSASIGATTFTIKTSATTGTDTTFVWIAIIVA